jgi:hypothetical protein
MAFCRTSELISDVVAETVGGPDCSTRLSRRRNRPDHQPLHLFSTDPCLHETVEAARPRTPPAVRLIGRYFRSSMTLARSSGVNVRKVLFTFAELGPSRLQPCRISETYLSSCRSIDHPGRIQRFPKHLDDIIANLSPLHQDLILGPCLERPLQPQWNGHLRSTRSPTNQLQEAPGRSFRSNEDGTCRSEYRKAVRIAVGEAPESHTRRDKQCKTKFLFAMKRTKAKLTLVNLAV